MIKKCKVILHNDNVTVVKYDTKDIQFPSIKNVEKEVYVEFKNGKYRVVTEDDFKKSIKNSAAKDNAPMKPTESYDKKCD